MNVRQHTATGNCHCTQQLGELLIIADCQLDVAWHDAGLLVVASGVTRELKHLEGKDVEGQKAVLSRKGTEGKGGEGGGG